MTQTIQDVMTMNPVTLSASSTVVDAARQMKEHDIGDVIVMKDDGGLCGIVTDRDIAIRAVAQGRDPQSTKLEDICSQDLVQLRPDEPIDRAVRLMRERAIRRLVVVSDDRPVGVVSMGDLAMEKDPKSALADVSAAPPNT